MEITININAPGLEHAMETLAIALGCSMDKGLGESIKEAVQQTPGQPVQQAPVQISQVNNVPVQQPTAPMQQVPIQQQPQMQQAPVQQAVPTQTQTYTMDQLAIAATQLMDAGKRNELIGLLGQFGVQALTALPKEQYGAFATALRSMGARI